MKRLPEQPTIPKPLLLGDLSSKPVRKRVPGLLNMTGNVLVSAYQKAGKTSLILDLMTGMTETGSFLGSLSCVTLQGSCVYVNMELEQNMLRKYCETLGMSLDNPNALFMDYRGLASEFLLADDEWCDDFVDMLWDLEAKALILDPIHPLVAMNGGDSDNNDESRHVLELLGRLARYAELDHLFVIDHTGHADKTRARGASSKGDWADIIWNVQPAGDEGRSLSAIGRDVNGNQQYTQDDDGRLVAGSSLRPTQSDTKPTVKNSAASYLRNEGGAHTVGTIAAAIKANEKQVSNALNVLEDEGQVVRHGKEGRSELWRYNM